MYSKRWYRKKIYIKKVYGKNRSVISSKNKSTTLCKCKKPPSFQNSIAKMFPSINAKLIMERSARPDTDNSVPPTIMKSVLTKIRRV